MSTINGELGRFFRINM